MDKKFNGTTVETNGVRSIAGGGTGATTAAQAKINLGITGGGVTSYNDLTDKPTLGTAAATASTDYATAAQGTDSRTPTAHKSSHATGGDDALSPADIGAAASSHTHPLSQLEQSAATNGQVVTWDATATAWVPATPASGGGSGGVTSYNDLTDKPTLGTAAATASTDYATAAQGTKADSALQSEALTPYRTSAAQDTIDGNKVTNGGGASTIAVMTMTAYNALAVKDNNTIYILT